MALNAYLNTCLIDHETKNIEIKKQKYNSIWILTTGNILSFVQYMLGLLKYEVISISFYIIEKELFAIKGKYYVKFCWQPQKLS